MDRKIAFYFEEIKDLGTADDLGGLVELHRKSFEQYGWEVVQLDESVARQHPLYAIFDDETSIFASSRNGWIYTRACYMRWLAYASAGHFFADFDVINYGFTYENALEMRQLARGPTFLSGATAVGLFHGSEYDQLLQAFITYKDRPFVTGSLEDDVNDMNILLQSRSDLFAITGTDDKRVARDYSCPGWDTADLVHFPYHYTKPPRAKTVLSERPPAYLANREYENLTMQKSDSDPSVPSHVSKEAWPAQMSRAEVINGILSLFENPRYLEIGVNTGETFFRSSADTKVAVDPSFLFDVDEAKRSHANCHFYPVVSDVYFGSYAAPAERFNVIYLDGLHTVEQTFRDFCNAIAFLETDGVIIIDDIIPSSFHAALPDDRLAWNVRNILGVKEGMWMGDVYRLLFLIETFFQQYRHATVIENHGQLVVWRSQRRAEEVVPRRVEDIGRAPYESVLLEAENFRRLPFAEIMALLRKR